MITKHGVKYDLDLGDRIQAIFYLTGLYEPHTISTCLDKLPLDQSSIFFDVGANVGLIVNQIKAKRPKAECHLFEADPKLHNSLERNITLNEFKSIFLNQNAVGENDGEHLVFQPSYNQRESGWGRLETNATQSGTGTVVTSVALDSYMARNNIQKIDLLKIDVEGAEERVLLGAKKALEMGKIKSIVCELNEGTLQAFNSSTTNIRNLLARFGYKEVGQNELNGFFVLDEKGQESQI